jgi:hypothetical protein
MAVTQWVDLPVETSGDPDTMSQADQDRLAKNPRWSPVYASASSASNSSYYDARGGTHRVSSRAVAGRLSDLGAQRTSAIARAEVRERALEQRIPDGRRHG